jgi:hypothetical protein
MTSLGLKGTKRRNVGGQWVDEPFEAPPSIVQAFLHQARTRRLDPLARQIYCIERGGKWGIEASIDGFRLQAERSGEYLGPTAGQWTDGTIVQVPLREDGNLVRDSAGNLIMTEDFRWIEVWVDPNTPPVAARIGIKRAGFPEPVWGVATYEGYCPRDRDGDLKPTGQWASNPSNQLLKCAEMLGLRKAFPAELSGIYGAEEMDQSGGVRGAAPAISRVERPVVVAVEEDQRDWASEIASCTEVTALTELANLTQARGLWGVEIAGPGGEFETVKDALFRRKGELEQPTVVDVEPEPVVVRDYLAEAKKTRGHHPVIRIYQEALAEGAPKEVTDSLEELAAERDSKAKQPEKGGEWAAAEPEATAEGWVGDVEPSAAAPAAEEAQ